LTSLRGSIVVSVLFTLFGGPGLTLVIGPWLITKFRMPAHEPLAQIVAAAALIGIGLTPVMESIVRFIRVGRGTLMPVVPTKHLVVSGLYRYVRNPMYVGVVTALAGEILLFWNRDLLIFAALVWLGMHLFVCFYEEPRLLRTYGEEYARFRQNVPRWIPRMSPWHFETATFVGE
jgi:protein-S-isoprenylcysteine O-methyltransferase Ste14